ncbi:biotin--[acetyl-CoA-carboxylase] ligase [Oligella urethralis]|uniref:Bifunctional protein BirA n=1 Tax=Oligella urethralis TaxID=90245 RepID=A0A2X1UJY8_9BURK|nr:biotin--[acetyl-CoA-carboxylase] ligase [Oligella urethralis]SPY07448.1 Bifunctional protein BirA [Oligella urethralis]
MPLITLPPAAQLAAKIKAELSGFAEVQWLEQVDSTNSQLINRARQAEPESAQVRPVLLGAYHQTQGKGRGGRTWKDLDKTTLMFSCAFDVDMPATQLPMLAPLCGIVVCEQLRQLVGAAHEHRLSMKWPNDILFDGAKLSGLLVEAVRPAVGRFSAHHHVVVIGMGLNLSHAKALSESLQRPVADWTSVLSSLAERESKAAANVSSMVALLANAWYQAILQYQKTGFEPFVARHAVVDALKQQTVDVLNGQELMFSGQAEGVDKNACLLVRTDEGVKQVIYGDISIRAIDPMAADNG